MTQGWDWDDQMDKAAPPRKPPRPPTPAATRYLRTISGILTAALIIGGIAAYRHHQSVQQLRNCVANASTLDPNSSDSSDADYLAWCKTEQQLGNLK